MKPLIKTPWANIPLSVPEPWRDFFDEYAQKLGVSRNAALCLALKLGGPILQRYFQVMKKHLLDHYDDIGGAAGASGKSGKSVPENPENAASAASASEILGTPALGTNHAKDRRYERRNNVTNKRRRASQEPGGREKGS